MTDPSPSGLQPHYQTYTRQKCFLAYSEQAPWSVDLLATCEALLSQPAYNLEVDYARKHFAADVPLRQKALELIANARYGIYDLSCWRQDDRSPWQPPRNVFIELGIAIALNRPLLLLRHASNRDLPLPQCLQSLSHPILEFSGTTTLKKILAAHLPDWIDTAPDTAWWNRYCSFGGRICPHREAHPSASQLGQQNLHCTIADGTDPCRPDFRSVIEDVLDRFSDVTYTYLDSLSLQDGYQFLLCSHCQSIRSSPFAIYRITPHTPAAAYIAIGISLALETQFDCKIPKILIAESVETIPSLLSGYEVITARNDKERKACLKKFMPTILKKLREHTWKPRPLPFTEISIAPLPAADIQEKNTDREKDQFFEELPYNESPIIGVEGLHYQLADCCKPVPGKPIIGIIEEGDRGIAIHQKGCSNTEQISDDRIISVSWNASAESSEDNRRDDLAYFEVEVIDRIGIVKEILSQFDEENVHIKRADIRTNSGQTAFIELSITSYNYSHLEEILDRVRKIDDVLNLRQIERIESVDEDRDNIHLNPEDENQTEKDQLENAKDIENLSQEFQVSQTSSNELERQLESNGKASLEDVVLFRPLKVGRAVTRIAPGIEGKVLVEGVYWKAILNDDNCEISVGEKVGIIARRNQNLTLIVEPLMAF